MHACVCVCTPTYIAYTHTRTSSASFQVAVVTAGVVVFNFGAPVKAGKGGGSDSTYGLALIAFSLFLDGLTGGLQVRAWVCVWVCDPVCVCARTNLI